jgi:hypothetical protein
VGTRDLLPADRNDVANAARLVLIMADPPSTKLIWPRHATSAVLPSSVSARSFAIASPAKRARFADGHRNPALSCGQRITKELAGDRIRTST